jgi:hypothetical protein
MFRLCFDHVVSSAFWQLSRRKFPERGRNDVTKTRTDQNAVLSAFWQLSQRNLPKRGQNGVTETRTDQNVDGRTGPKHGRTKTQFCPRFGNFLESFGRLSFGAFWSHCSVNRPCLGHVVLSAFRLPKRGQNRVLVALFCQCFGPVVPSTFRQLSSWKFWWIKFLRVLACFGHIVPFVFRPGRFVRLAKAKSCFRVFSSLSPF